MEVFQEVVWKGREQSVITCSSLSTAPVQSRAVLSPAFERR